jgi:uncharacterized protein with von Willebrand factor type A (vWA) domain
LSFLDKFNHKNDNRPQADAKGFRHTVENDRWDAEDWNACLHEMKDVSVADDALRKVTPTGHEAMGDTFFALVKADPTQRKQSDVRPSYAVNHAVMKEAMGLKEYQELRTYSVGDEVATGLAVVSMEPELEVLFDKLKDQQKLAQQIEEMLQQQQGLEDQSDEIDKLMEDMVGDPDLEQQKQDLDDQIQDLQDQIDGASQDLQDQLNQQGPAIRQSMQSAMKDAVEQAENMDNLSLSWGLEPGALTRMPAQKRIELAKRVNTEKFKKLAELIGPMQRLAMSEQQRKTNFSKDEVYDIEFGNDLSHILPVELLGLAFDEDEEDEELRELLELQELNFFQRFMNEKLLQFKLQGIEKVAKGSIIFCEDGSGSMGGNNEVWAKAVGLALLHIARMQKRDFYGVHFGSKPEIATFDFDIKGASVLRQIQKQPAETLEYIDGVVEFAEFFWNGGTDFMTPLSHALDKLRAQFEENGAVKGDIVFVTDGLCNVDATWLDEFKAEQARLDFKVYGILIGGYGPDGEPLKTICDGRVFTIKELMSGKDVADLFRGI